MSYLEAKHLLLLSYCIHIVFYLLLKAEGRPVRDHPVIARSVGEEEMMFMDIRILMPMLVTRQQHFIMERGSP